MSVIRDAVEAWKSRLAELEAQIAPLADEAEQLRTAIARLDAIEPAKAGRRTRAAPPRRAPRAAARAVQRPARPARREPPPDPRRDQARGQDRRRRGQGDGHRPPTVSTR